MLLQLLHIFCMGILQKGFSLEKFISREDRFGLTTGYSSGISEVTEFCSGIDSVDPSGLLPLDHFKIPQATF